VRFLDNPDLFLWIIAALFACAAARYSYNMQGWKAVYCACAALINVSVIMQS
jgi:hypothetical protein